MATERDLGGAHCRAFEAAAKRFPHAEFTILRLIRSRDSFRELCEELADAEIALSKVPECVAAHREARQREWEEIVDELLLEISNTLEGY